MGATVDPRVLPALEFQRAAVGHASLASPLYAALLDAAITDLGSGGPCARVLAAMPEGIDPIPDALALRFLGAVHRLVLAGEAPALARWFPTAGGLFVAATDAGAAAADFRDAVAEHEAALLHGLRQGVQTNEVGRCATLAVGFTEVLRSTGLPLRLLEVGASAGLNLRWDRWRYESGGVAWGDEAAPLRFVDAYRSPEPDVSAPLGVGAAVASRAGCDRAPIDAATPEGELLLRSFVWPDQAARHQRLTVALAAAREVPATVEAADAADYLRRVLAEPVEGVATVVFHSIVWQYLPASTREGVRAALDAAGAIASAPAPLAWLRMEPGPDPNEAAELRLTTWPGGADRLLALSGYHGNPVWAA